MSWPGIIRFAADIHAAVSDGLYLAADLLDRGLDVYDDEGATVTVEGPANTRSLWDQETGDGLAEAADREARISAIALLAERHRVRFDFVQRAYDCACDRQFTDLDVWAEHVAELITDAIDSLIVPAAPQSGGDDAALGSSAAVQWPAPPDAADSPPIGARGAGHPNTTE